MTGMPLDTSIVTEQYTASVSWEPGVSPAVIDTIYTATLIITPLAGYTLVGVSNFTVAGASVNYVAGSDTVEVIFPATVAHVPMSLLEDGGKTILSTFSAGDYLYVAGSIGDDAFIGKYSVLNQTWSWTRNAPGLYNDPRFTGVVLDGAFLYVGGTYGQTLVYDGTTITSPNTKFNAQSGVIIKINESDGALVTVFNNFYASNEYDQIWLTWLHKADDGVVAVGTYLNAYGVPSAAYIGGVNLGNTGTAKTVFVSKLLSTGTFQWSKKLETGLYSNPFQSKLENNVVYVSGYAPRYITINSTSYDGESTRAYLIGLNVGDGSLNTIRRFGEAESTLWGFATATNMLVSEHTLTATSSLSRYDGSFNLIWTRPYTTTGGIIYVLDMFIGNNESIYILGYGVNSFTCDGVTFTYTSASHEVYLMTLTPSGTCIKIDPLNYSFPNIWTQTSSLRRDGEYLIMTMNNKVSRLFIG